MIVTSRDAEILKERESGKTYRAIGQAYGLSVERTRQICVITKRRLERGVPKDPFYGLSTRAQNAIKNVLGSDATPEQVARTDPRVLLGSYNFGRRSLVEVREWLKTKGLNMPAPPAPEPNPETLERYANHLRKYGWTVTPPTPTTPPLPPHSTEAEE